MKEIYNYVKAEEDKGKNKKEYFLGKKWYNLRKKTIFNLY